VLLVWLLVRPGGSPVGPDELPVQMVGLQVATDELTVQLDGLRDGMDGSKARMGACGLRYLVACGPHRLDALVNRLRIRRRGRRAQTRNRMTAKS
jgi:hypothetical protein